MNKDLTLTSNPERINSTELFDACLSYKCQMNELELAKAQVRYHKEQLKPIIEKLNAYTNKPLVIFKEGTDEKIELLWEPKITPANDNPKPTEEKIRYIPIIKES